MTEPAIRAKPPAGTQRSPDAAQRAALAACCAAEPGSISQCREIGPGSAEQREERCTASGTRAKCAPTAFLHQTGLTNLQRRHSVPRTQRSAQRCAAEPGSISQCREIGPGSAEQREERCTASGTRAEFALAAFLHQTRLTNLRRCHSVPRTQRSAQRCAAEALRSCGRRHVSRV
jgi:hypothetical protein